MNRLAQNIVKYSIYASMALTLVYLLLLFIVPDVSIKNEQFLGKIAILFISSFGFFSSLLALILVIIASDEWLGNIAGLRFQLVLELPIEFRCHRIRNLDWARAALTGLWQQLTAHFPYSELLHPEVSYSSVSDVAAVADDPLAPTFTSFSRGSVTDQCSTYFGRSNVWVGS